MSVRTIYRDIDVLSSSGVGYTKKLFDFVLDYNTEVELIESIKTGGIRCIMKVTRK